MLPAAERDGGPAPFAGSVEAREGRALGSRLVLLVAVGAATCDGPASGAVDSAWEAVVGAFAAVDAALSGFRADSELCRRQDADDWDGLSWRLRAALVLCDRAHRRTAGRFDPRILDELQALGFGPPVARSNAARQTAGESLPPPRSGPVLERGPGGWRPTGPIDLGGIGKGLALRWAARAAAPHLGDHGFLIDAGGDITTSGPDADWTIGIEDPAGAPRPVATCALAGGSSIATSSTRVWKRPHGTVSAHHLIDPRSGASGGDGLSSVTVVWPDPAWAEVWSKALFLAGAAAIASEARARGVAAWWVGTDGSLSMTPAARQLTTWVRDEAGLAVPPGRRRW